MPGEAAFLPGPANACASGARTSTEVMDKSDKPAAVSNPTAADVKTLPNAKEDEGFDYVLDAMNGPDNMKKENADYKPGVGTFLYNFFTGKKN
ncbi:hypothetical protein WJX81_006096 [Elliptochloris bilobata]|uniref:Uncharacterized protein n=1 Tax=Elliptochloris bilobata TaxID=381761 RepID=A0AAW1SLC5_9CHLO